MPLKIKVKLVKFILSVYSHLTAVELACSLTLNPILWFQKDSWIALNYLWQAETESRKLYFQFFGFTALFSYIDASYLLHNFEHQLADLASAQLKSEGKTLESAGLADLEPKNCAHFSAKE